jgi:Zn-dependent M28 family amino/carboxypeptidase
MITLAKETRLFIMVLMMTIPEHARLWNWQKHLAKQKQPEGTKKTIVFMTVSGEEEGLWGSAFYGDHPVFPLDKTTRGFEY